MDPFDHDPFNELPPPKPRSCRFRPKPRKPEEASSSSIASEIPEAGSSGTTALSEILLVEKSGPREDTITLSEDPDAGPSDTTALSGIIVVEKSDPREDTITLSEDADAGPSDTTALSEILVVEKSGPREDTITLKYSRISEFCQAYISSMLNQSNHQSSVQKSVVMKGTPVGMYCDGLLVLCTWFVESPNGAKLESSSLVEVGEFSEDRVKTFKNLWQDCGGAEVCFLCVPSDFSSGHVKTLKSEILSSGFAFCFLSEFVKSLACGFLEESAIFDCGLGDKFVVFIQANRQSIELSFVKYAASVGLHLVRSLIDRDVPVDCVIEVYVERLNSLLDKFAPMTYYALRNASVVVLGGSYSSCRAVIEALGSRFNVAVEEYDVKTVSKGAVFAGYSLIFEDPICKLNFLIQNAKFDSMSSIGGDEICLNCGVIKVNEDGEDGDREPEVDCCDKCVQPICTDCKLEGCSWCKFVGFSLMQTMRRYLHSGDLRRCEQVFKDYMNSGKQATVELYVTLAEGATVGYSPWGMQLAFETLEEMTARGFKLNPEMGNDLLLAASGEKDGGYTMANYVWDLMRSGNITPSPPAVEAYYLGLKERDIPADDKRLILVSRTYDKQCQRFGQGPG